MTSVDDARAALSAPASTADLLRAILVVLLAIHDQQTAAPVSPRKRT